MGQWTAFPKQLQPILCAVFFSAQYILLSRRIDMKGLNAIYFQVNELQAQVLEAKIGKDDRKANLMLDNHQSSDIAMQRESSSFIDFSALLDDMTAVQQRQEAYLDRIGHT